MSKFEKHYQKLKTQIPKQPTDFIPRKEHDKLITFSFGFGILIGIFMPSIVDFLLYIFKYILSL